MMRAPLFITMGVMILLLGLCHTLIQPQHLKPHQHHNPMTLSRRTQTVAMFSMVQAPIDSRIKESELKSTSASENLNNRKQLIEEVGTAFAQKLFELERFQQENGHCLVPKRYQNNPSLGNWVNKQRQNYRRHLMGENNTLNQKRINALNNIGFVWNTTSVPYKSSHNENMWRKMYRQLTEYHAINQHCRVPSSTLLGQWVVRQRFLYRQHPMGEAKSSLTDERIRLLDDLNFQWMTRSEEMWNIHVSELREFKQQYGHALVPKNYPQNPQLSAWVSTQRKNFKLRQDGKPSPLTLTRVTELDEIGFVWNYWDHNFMAARKDQLR